MPLQHLSETESEQQTREEAAREEGALRDSHRWGKFVPYIIAASDILTASGAGMTIKYFNLFWRQDFNLTASQVMLIAAFQALFIGLFSTVLERVARYIGRAQTSLKKNFLKENFRVLSEMRGEIFVYRP